MREEKVFKDPVHKYIYVQDQTVWDLINAKEFQRMRRIRQLGTSYFTFHGAEHSRFSHSLGVYEITRKILSTFERYEYGDWPREDRLLILCAALLHDVGHGPFSHSLESVFGVRHESWSCRIIREDSDIHHILSGVSPDFPNAVASVIDKSYANALTVGLISGQMDADRMDYLLRDAYFSGVNYGMFDLERLLRVIRPHRDRIVVKESGMHTVEDYLMSRYQMYWQVYFHPVTRSSEIILRLVFQRAKELYREGYRFEFMVDPLPRLFAGELRVDDYLLMDEALVQTAMVRWTREKDPVLAELAGRFIHRKLFKYIALPSTDDPLVAELAAAMGKAGIDPAYYLEWDYPSDLPYDVYRPGKEAAHPIYLLAEGDKLVEISERSAIVRSISGIRHGAHNLYFPEDLPDRANLSAGLRERLGFRT